MSLGTEQMKQIKIVNPIVPKWNELKNDFKEIVESKELTTGKWTERCEKKIAKIHGCKYVILTSSATQAFMLLCMAADSLYDIKKVKMQDFTWKSVKDIAQMIFRERLELEDFPSATVWSSIFPITNNNTLIIPTMSFGQIKSYEDYGMYKFKPLVIYDSTHCFGTKECNGRGLGEVISFSPAKIITAGEGGAIITNNVEIYNFCKKNRRYHGRIPEFCSCLLYHNINNYVNRKKLILNNLEWYSKYLSMGTVGNILWYHGEAYRRSKNKNTLLFIHTGLTEKIIKKIGRFMQIRQRYEPTNKDNKKCDYIYNHSLEFPILETENEVKNLCKKINRCFKK